MLWLICVLTLPFERKIKIKEKNPQTNKGFFLVEIQIITQSYIVYFSIISIIILSIHLCEFIHLFISKTTFQHMLKDFILILSYKRSSCVSWFGVKCKISVIINSTYLVIISKICNTMVILHLTILHFNQIIFTLFWLKSVARFWHMINFCFFFTSAKILKQSAKNDA